MLSNGIIATRYCANKGVPVGLQESENAGFRRFECLYYEGRVKLTEGTDYTYVVEGSDGSGTGCVVLTGMGDYCGTFEKTFKVKSNEVEPRSVVYSILLTCSNDSVSGTRTLA